MWRSGYITVKRLTDVALQVSSIEAGNMPRNPHSAQAMQVAEASLEECLVVRDAGAGVKKGNDFSPGFSPHSWKLDAATGVHFMSRSSVPGVSAVYQYVKLLAGGIRPCPNLARSVHDPVQNKC